MEQKPILITLTSPSCGGKSYLYSHIRDVAKLPCIVSTTTRPPRSNEVEGVDYYFITEEQSKQMEEADMFAELVIYNGVRYGVTKQEIKEKLSKGICFLIVEPSGAEQYEHVAETYGADWMKVFIDTPLDIRIDRFNTRIQNDLTKELAKTEVDQQKIFSLVKAAIKRGMSIVTEESRWVHAYDWDHVIDGTIDPQKNLDFILSLVKE